MRRQNIGEQMLIGEQTGGLVGGRGDGVGRELIQVDLLYTK